MGAAVAGCASLRSSLPSGWDELVDLLDEFDGREKFESICVFGLPINRLTQHHQVCLSHRAVSATGSLLGCCFVAPLKYLRLDFGTYGILFEDGAENACDEPDGVLLEEYGCEPDPATVRMALMEVQPRPYDLLTWNCQHFSAHLLKRLAVAKSVPALKAATM
mmetsp:Transcript_67918/g.196652  ORF Transcript_67918/g.196652 Transcript_67918/m.196652 type:complete len:163 (+) Transcript_67918:48-536(+)